MQNFYVNVAHPEISVILQKEAFKAGYNWECWKYDKQVVFTDSPTLYFDFKSKLIFRNVYEDEEYKKYSIEQALSFFKSRIKLSSHTGYVYLPAKQVVIDNVTLTFDDIAKLYLETQKEV